MRVIVKSGVYTESFTGSIVDRNMPVNSVANLKIHGFIGSMSRVENCWGNKRSVVSRADKREDNVRHNSVAESFFGSLKQEQIHWQYYLTRYAAQQDVLQYISMFYNSQRLHSYLGYKNPNQYEAEIEKLKNVA